MSHERSHGGGIERSREVEALDVLAPERTEGSELRAPFDALGDDGELQRVAKGDDRAGERPAFLVGTVPATKS